MPATQASLLQFLKHSTLTLASGPLHMIWPLPSMCRSHLPLIRCLSGFSSSTSPPWRGGLCNLLDQVRPPLFNALSAPGVSISQHSVHFSSPKAAGGRFSRLNGVTEFTIVLFLFFLMFIDLFILRERERASGGGAEREGHRESRAGSTPSAQIGRAHV